MITSVMICLGNSEDKNFDGILKLLGVLLSSDVKAEDKRKVLEQDFDIQMTEKLERQVVEMCNLSKGVMEKGVEKGLVASIESLMHKLKMTADQAMDAKYNVTMLNNTYYNDFFEGLDESIIHTLSMGEASVMTYDPVRNFMHGFINLISVEKIRIAHGKFHSRDLNLFDGFEDDEFLYALEGRIYPKVRDYLLASLVPFYLSAREIRTMLAEEGFTISWPNGKGKRTYSARINIEGSEK